MKHKPVTLCAYLVLCCSTEITLAASPTTVEDNSDQLETIDYHQPPPSPGQENSNLPTVDISGVFNHLSDQDIGGALNELSRLQREHPGWAPPAPLLQVINQYPNRSLADNRYLLLMTELDLTSKSGGTEIPSHRLELATVEIRRRKDGYHAVKLGWIQFQRQDYIAANHLFILAGEWGEATQARRAQSLVSLRLAEQAVATNDYVAALRYAQQAAELGSDDSYIATGWMLFKKQAYDHALTAFSHASPSVEKEQALAETCFQQSLQSIAAGNDDLALEAARCSEQHGRSDAMTTLGWMLYEDGKYTLANRFFTARHPPSEQSRYGTVLSLKAGGDHLTAREISCRNYELSPRIKTVCVELYSARMLADYQAGRHEAVLRDAIELQQYRALSRDLSALLAWSELSLEHYNTAAKRFDKLLSQQPEEASHAHGLLKSLAYSDNPTAVADARTRHPLLENILSRQTASEIPLPPPFSSRGHANPSDKPPSASIDANLLSQAIELYHAKHYQRAHKLLLQLRPGIIASRDSGLLTLAGWTAFHVGNYEQARDDFLIAAKWTDDDGIWLMLVEAEIALQNPERGREIVDGLPPSPKRDKMLARLIPLQAVAAYHKGDYARTESLLSTEDFSLNDDDLEMLGWSRYQQGKYELAGSAFEAAYRIKPKLARAKGLVFSHMHQRQPAKLVALADKLQGPLAELTADEEVRKKLSEGREDWIGVSPEAVLIVKEPPKQTSALTRALRKLEAIPGFTWGSIDHSFDDNDTHVSFLLNQGIDWVVLPGDITLNTFVEYRSMHNDLKSVYDDNEFVVGLEFQRSPFNLGIEHSPAEWRGDAQQEDITTTYLGWYHSWYKYLRRRRSTISNPLNANAYAGSTYGRISNQLDDGGGTTARGFVRQGVDWFTSITSAGEITLNTYGAYRFRFRTKDNYWYDAHGPALGIELQRSPFSLGVEYMRQISPRRHTSESIYGMYLTWYYDWDLRPE